MFPTHIAAYPPAEDGSSFTGESGNPFRQEVYGRVFRRAVKGSLAEQHTSHDVMVRATFAQVSGIAEASSDDHVGRCLLLDSRGEIDCVVGAGDPVVPAYPATVMSTIRS